jgi:hypothetical protein
MADEKEEDKKPEEAKEEETRVGKVGVKDAGEIVTTAGGSKISGILSDIADGD